MSIDLCTLGVLLGLGVVSVITRSFFFISARPWQLPHWAQRGLQYAPIAALAAVVIPEVGVAQGQLITTWPGARSSGGAACSSPSWRACACTCRCTSAWAGSPRSRSLRPRRVRGDP